MTKIDRNQPCPCGSGKKFKYCHGRLAPSGAAGPLPSEVWTGIDQKLKEVKALHARREKQQGLGRPIVSTKTDSGRIIVVGDCRVNSGESRRGIDGGAPPLPNTKIQLSRITPQRAFGPAPVIASIMPLTAAICRPVFLA
jgi:hypothetical protein